MDLRRFLKLYDKDRSGSLDRDEFFRLFRSSARHKMPQSDLSKMFDLLDEDHSGDISETEFLAFVEADGAQGMKRFVRRMKETHARNLLLRTSPMKVAEMSHERGQANASESASLPQADDLKGMHNSMLSAPIELQMQAIPYHVPTDTHSTANAPSKENTTSLDLLEQEGEDWTDLKQMQVLRDLEAINNELQSVSMHQRQQAGTKRVKRPQEEAYPVNFDQLLGMQQKLRAASCE